MNEVKRYDIRVSLGGVESYESPCGDYVDYEDYAALEAKCEALAAELKQSRIDAECYKKGMEASNARLVQLAAENAALKSGAMDEIEVINRGGQAYCVKDGVQVNPMYARGWNDYRAKSMQSETPATDAFLAEVRAQGVDMARNAMIDFVDGEVWPNKNVPGLIRGAEICVSIAEQLRKGGEQK